MLAAGASLGTGSNKVTLLDWASLDVNLADRLEVALVARVQEVAMAPLADSMSDPYVGLCNAFVK
jgi:hypothetical protein